MHYIHTRDYRHMAVVFGTTLIEPDNGIILIIRTIIQHLRKNSNLLLKLHQLTGQVKLK